MKKSDFKKLFIELMNLKKDEEALNKAFRMFNPDFNYLSFSRYEALVVNILKIAVNDKGGWIEYFLYERNGKFTKEKIIQDKNGKKLPFRNIDDLYNLIEAD